MTHHIRLGGGGGVDTDGTTCEVSLSGRVAFQQAAAWLEGWLSQTASPKVNPFWLVLAGTLMCIGLTVYPSHTSRQHLTVRCCLLEPQMVRPFFAMHSFPIREGILFMPLMHRVGNCCAEKDRVGSPPRP